MTSGRQCMEFARDCMRLAGLCEDERRRDQLLTMAHEWMTFAMQGRPVAVDRRAPLQRAVCGGPGQ
jgi:hypothetical protein